MKINDMQSIFVVVVICYFDDLPCAHTNLASLSLRLICQGRNNWEHENEICMSAMLEKSSSSSVRTVCF